MGWLRDLMGQSAARPRSYGELARIALADADWPAESRMGERSLAAMLSKLDRDQELEWLSERTGVQQALARTLQVPLDDVRSAFAPTAAVSDDVRRVRLEDLRFARALDLASEPLPPGLPPEALNPAAWGATFWRAASGSGRSLVGRYLQARGLASYVTAPRLDAAFAKLPAHGPVFVELTEELAELPPAPRREICVAGACATSPVGAAAWRCIESPALGSYLEPLVHWIAERLPTDGHFDARAIREWLEGKLEERGLLDGVGAVIGFCGLAEELGLREISGKSLRQLAEQVVRDRLTTAIDPAASHAGWLQKHGFTLLLGLAKRLLTDSDRPTDEPRSLDEWLTLIPAEHQREPDLEWMRMSLTRADSGIRPADIDKAAREIPPGSFRILRAFEQARFLRRVDGERLALSPRWLHNVLRRSALAELVAGSPFEWGEALLRQPATTDVAREIMARVEERGARAIEQTLELEAAENPAQVAALEMHFRATGLALLSGSDIPTDTLEALWDSALRYVIELPGELPLPRIGYAGTLTDARLSSGAFYLAALAISAQLPRGTGAAHAVLRPWLATAPDPDLQRLYAVIWRDLTRDSRVEPWKLSAFALIHRLRNEVGLVATPETVHPLEQPSMIIDEVVYGVLSLGTLASLASRPLVLAALADHARERNVPFAQVARALWTAWDAAARPSQGTEFLAPDAPERAAFWPHIPEELLTSLLRDARATDVPYDLFGEEQWQAFLAALPHAPRLADDPKAWHSAPAAVVSAALEQGVATQALFTSLWQNAPERAASELERVLESSHPDSERLELLLETADDRAARLVLAAFDAHPRLWNTSSAALTLLRRFLHSYVAERRPNHRQAYAKLAEIEQRLADARGDTVEATG
jgi:hypothetical protein